MDDFQREERRKLINKPKLKPPFAEITEQKAELGAALKEIREELEIPIRKMVELTGLSKRTIWRLEKGRPVKLDSILKVLFVLNYELELIEVSRIEI